MKAWLKVKNEASQVQLIQIREVRHKTQIKNFLRGKTRSTEPMIRYVS